MAPKLEPIPVTSGSPSARSVALDSCRVNLARFPAGLSLATHIHEKTIVAVTLEGVFDISFSSRTLTTRRGFVHVEPATERHGNAFARDGATVLALEIDPEAEQDLLRPCARLFESPWSGASPESEIAARGIARELRHPDDVTGLAVEGLVLGLLGSAARIHAGEDDRMPPRWLARSRELIRDLFRRPMPIREIAREVGVHPIRLMRGFQKHYRTSPAAYLRTVRLDWALDQLATSDEPVSMVAARAGYADQSHLTRVVKRHTGLTPRRYRAVRRKPG